MRQQCPCPDTTCMRRWRRTLCTVWRAGFREQTAGWPQQPVVLAGEWLATCPRRWVVADMGCGDAALAAAVPQRVHSFDLVSTAPGVVACNMAAVPLPPCSVDVVVFCLSLMGVDYGTFVEEAARLLRPCGIVWIAEVASRFVDERGASVLNAFLAAARARGLTTVHRDASNPYFILLRLAKEGPQREGPHDGAAAAERRPRKSVPWPTLRACLYKKR